ncbi:hypothetical protein PAE9249_02719 [Paenibacillus sp. CECT 9249]|uniref:hypothetical protein n=1 Tax=Paenibacillus sp. CECT 9249 TaxID=2845385 RepID=UPI001E2C9FD1|nr:hypothetical protein [Paenibacillus sp. CECT 9249]CAH0120205.1 hypothetical protein PAE9249_02719 [Paenibacillus sp. CECT 9249]
MTFYPEMFLSKWHLITLALIAIAWIALIVGGYDRRVVLRSGFGAIIGLYIITTIPIAVITYQEKSIDKAMREQSDRHYEYKMQQLDGPVREIDRLTVATGSFRDDDLYEIRIYAGNYNDSYRFHGSLTVRTYDEQGQILDERMFDDLYIEPGEVKKIDSYYTSSQFETYRYQFTPDQDS